MKRLFSAVAAIAVALSVTATQASAQYVFLGAGLTVPVGDYAEFPSDPTDGAKAGWMANAGAVFPVGEGRVSVGGSAFYGSNSHEVTGDKTDLYGAMGLVGVTLSEPDAAARPFVFGGLGYITHSYKSEDFPAFEGSTGSLAAQGGAGVAFPLGSIGGMLAASYTTGFGDNSETTYMGVMAAAQIPVGN